jgi:K+-sensing histidine kinase KdpD
MSFIPQSSRIAQHALFGASFCAGVTALMCALVDDSWESRASVPVIALLGVIFTSQFWGRVAGFVGSFAASLVFDACLFPPFGSLAIEDPLDLTWFGSFHFCSIIVVLVCPRNGLGIHVPQRR